MKIENQCVSLELAKKLKELGVKQESLFYWDKHENLYHHLDREQGFMLRLSDETHHDGTTIGEFFSAFTVAELGEMLPAQLHIEVSVQHPVHQFITEKQFSQWHAVYICAGCMGKLGSQIAHTEADARAAMLVYLLENKLI